MSLRLPNEIPAPNLYIYSGTRNSDYLAGPTVKNSVFLAIREAMEPR
jgi:hypothetical protein